MGVITLSNQEHRSLNSTPPIACPIPSYSFTPISFSFSWQIQKCRFGISISLVPLTRKIPTLSSTLSSSPTSLLSSGILSAGGIHPDNQLVQLTSQRTLRLADEKGHSAALRESAKYNVSFG